MSKRRIVWGILLVFSFLLFYSWIPVNFYNNYPLALSAIGAALFIFFLAQVTGDFKSWEEFNTKDKSLHDWRHRVIPFFVIPAIGMIFVFYMHFSSKEEGELRRYGQQAKGTVIDGSSLTNLRGSGTYSVTVSFYTKKGELMNVKKDVTKEDFHRFYKGQTVDLIYSTQNASMIELLLTDDTVHTYTGVENRDMTVSDLTRLISLYPDSIGTYLNAISYRWTLTEDSSWVNEQKNLLVRVIPGKRVMYISLADHPNTLINQLKQDHFKEDSVVSAGSSGLVSGRKMRVYKSDRYAAVLQTKIIKTSLATVLHIEKI